MGAATTCLAWAALLAQFVAVDPSVHPDDFVSISCPANRSCLILDAAGNLWFSPDGGSSLVHRSNQQAIGLTTIRFGGLIDGWGLDRMGGLWWSQDGGRSFRSIPYPGDSPAADIRGTKESWLATRKGAIYRLQRAKGAAAILAIPQAGLKFFDFDPAGVVAAVTDDGTLFVSTDLGRNWSRSKPLPGGAAGLALGRDGNIVVSGCRGTAVFSSDSGKSFKSLRLPDHPESWSSVCLVPAGFLSDGRILLFGLPGNVLIGQPESGSLSNLRLPPDRIWRSAAAVGSSRLVLVGNGGALARLKVPPDREPVLEMHSKDQPTVTDMQTVGRGHLWAAYMNGEIHYSPDGGVRWETLQTLGQDPVRLAFIDEKHGYALAGFHTILGTVDGGRRWKNLGHWPDTFFNDIFFIDRKNGWAAGKIGCVMRTTDGGTTWTLDRLPTDRDLNRIQFVDALRGWIVGDKQAVFRSQDGGRSWSRLRSGRGSLYGLHFENHQHGWVCGEAGLMLHTTDGGDSFTLQTISSNDNLKAILFLDSNRGLVGGETGQIFLTKDGGANWRLIQLMTRSNIADVACDRRTARCLVGGDQGLLMAGNPFLFHP